MAAPNLNQSGPQMAPLPGDTLASQNEKPCPECGEKVRAGMVRCWNCGAFMNPDLEAKFRKMQTAPKKILLSMPEDGAVAAEAPDEEDDEFSFTLSLPTDKPVIAVTPTAAPKVAEVVAKAEEKPETTKDTAKKEGRSKGDIPHSEATGGDALLDIAMKETAEVQERRKKRKLLAPGAKTPNGFLIFCPWGCRIEVKEQHRGMQGKCPRCKAPFIVPTDPPVYKTDKKAGEDGEAATAADASGGFKLWMHDLHWHSVSPEKMKLVADSLAKDFVEVDLGFSNEGLWAVTLMKKAGGMFGGGGGGPEKKKEARDALLKSLADGNPAAAMPAIEKRMYNVDQLREFRVVQPVANRLMSMFAGIPVFGVGRIAIQVPHTDDTPLPQYLTCGILEFRRIAAALTEYYGITGLGADSGIPVEDVYLEHKCHFSSAPVRGLQNLEYYQADPTAKLELSGWQCVGCSVAISEVARNKENIGGKGGKGIAKAKCPKCKQKLGERPLYALPSAVVEPTITGETQPAQPVTPDAAAPVAKPTP